jgi:hypothetical protein
MGYLINYWAMSFDGYGYVWLGFGGVWLRLGLVSSLGLTREKESEASYTKVTVKFLICCVINVCYRQPVRSNPLWYNR